MTHEQQQPPSAPHPTSPLARARLTVWHTAPPGQPGSLPADLVRRLLDDHTQPGQVVIDLDDDPTILGVAAAIGRVHHMAPQPADISRQAGEANLVLVRWPRPAINPQHLLQTARDLLRDGGHLAIAVQVQPRQRTAHLSALTGAARTAGFQPVRHIVAIAPTDEDCAQTETVKESSPHPHTDLLVFQTRTARHV
jgi:hypothetical protein